jgi:NADH-quinone oxidoreductase subunit E
MAKLLSQQFLTKMKKLEPRYPTKVALMLPALHAAQDEYGWLPQEILNEVAEYIGCQPAQVRAVASFYTMFNLKPVGKYHLKICTNVACMLRGSDEIMSHCKKRFGVQKGETTSDRRFTLSEEECLGSCGTAPMMLMNGKYYENLTREKMDQLLDGLE